ncbi:hypothetical protein AB6A40_010317 [Gnathostoma spinigerum]|uniref:Uncharacterized protein n=1 Tax=Gnathostoma spinigerum TaxID=75299 RepID=A0ABD6F1I3_9BILA
MLLSNTAEKQQSIRGRGEDKKRPMTSWNIVGNKMNTTWSSTRNKCKLGVLSHSGTLHNIFIFDYFYRTLFICLFLCLKLKGAFYRLQFLFLKLAELKATSNDRSLLNLTTEVLSWNIF